MEKRRKNSDFTLVTPRPAPRTACAVRGALRLAVTALLCVASAPALVAQPQDVFFDAVDVPVVEVDVTVTDRKGRAATGLEPGDFELYVDGERVEVTNFSRPSHRRTMESDAGGTAVPDLPHGDQTPPDNPASTPLTVAIYLDELNLHPPHRARIVKRLRAALEPLRRPGVRFLLATMRDRLEVLAAPTADVEAILTAVASRPKADPRSIEGFFARRRALQEIGNTARIQGAEACSSGAMLAVARKHAHSFARRVSVSADGLADLITTLSGVPGRKAVLYVSDGLPQRPGISVFEYIAHERCPDDARTMSEVLGAMLEFDESRRLQRIAAHANANRVTLFPLDAAGLRPGLAHSLALDARPSLRNDNLHRMNAQGGLYVLADETGGKLLANSNDLAELLEDVSVDLAATYSLGFVPATPTAGEVRTIDVLLAPDVKKGLRVRHRASYRTKTQDERLAERLLAVAYLGSGDNPFHVEVAFQAAPPTDESTETSSKRRKARQAHALVVGIDVPRTSLAGYSEGVAGSGRELGLWLLAANRKNGARTSVRRKTVPVVDNADPDSADSARLNYLVTMELPAGQYDVAVGVRDEFTGIMSFVREPVTVPIEPATVDAR